MSDIARVADAINAKRRREVLSIYSNYEWFKAIAKDREDKTYSKGGKAMRKVATVPFEIDHFFCKAYGEDYYKDPDFFTKRHTEWSLGKTKEDPQESAKFVRKAFEKQVYEDINPR